MPRTPSSSTSLRATIGVWIMATLLALYIGFALHRVWLLLTAGNTVGAVMGAALLVISLIAAWALARELVFGWQANRLTRRLEEEDQLLHDSELDSGWDGRPDRAAAAAALVRYEEAANTAPDDWRAWHRLGIVRRAAGQHGQARQAIRRAIALERGER